MASQLKHVAAVLAGGNMGHVSESGEHQSASGSLMPLSLAAYSLLLAIQVLWKRFRHRNI